MSNISNNIKTVIEEVRQLVIASGNDQDLTYFEYHEPRYLYMANSVSKLCEPGAKVLEMGSHYLHSSLILTKLGFEVYAMDVDVFWNIPFVQNRGKEFGINKVIENDLEEFGSQNEVNDFYDLILFTEILEHITFNPINFWKKVYRSSKNGAKIYISTPNSFALPSLVRATKNLISFKSLGLGLDQIFLNVTYGHHWKEYSAGEIRRYFKRMSSDFVVSTKKYHCKKIDSSSTPNLLWSYLLIVGNWTYVLSSDIEAIVTINKTDSPWGLEAPAY